jgi:hypothetical protein
MTPTLLLFLLSCLSKVESPKPPIDLPLSGSFCFDGFIRNFVKMECKAKKTGEGPMNSKIFSCQVDNKTVQYFVVIPSTVEEVDPRMMICQDDFVFLVKYEDEII